MSKKLSGRRCVCRGCGEYFNSVPAFDKHRVGSYMLPDGSCGRRCLTHDEMLEAGMRLPEHGFWVTAAMPEGLRFVAHEAANA